MIAAAVATRSCTTMRIWRGVSLGTLMIIFPDRIGGSGANPYRCLRTDATPKAAGAFGGIPGPVAIDGGLDCGAAENQGAAGARFSAWSTAANTCCTESSSRQRL